MNDQPPHDAPRSVPDDGASHREHIDASQALAAFLNQLLDGERSGARVARALAREAAPDAARTLLAIARDEAWCCLMLTRELERMGAKPRRGSGAFFDKVMALDSLAARLELLDRGQAWVVRKLGEMLPGIRDPGLRRELHKMLDKHERNLQRAALLKP